MEISSPGEMVSKVIGNDPNNPKKTFSIKAKSTLQGMFFGGVAGFMIAYKTEKNKYIGIISGVLLGGFISNMLTIKKQ